MFSRFSRGKDEGKTEATPLKTEPAEPAGPSASYGVHGHTSLLGATALLSTFSTTSSNVMYPSIYGTLGSFAGPVLQVALQGLMAALTVLTCRIAVRLKCSTFSELGLALGGPRGRMVLGFAQQLNNALFMPVALVFSSDALRDVVLVSLGCTTADESELLPLDVGSCAWWACNINALWIIAVIAWPVLLLARDVGELTFNAYLSIALIVVQTGAIFAAVAQLEPSGDAANVGPPLQLFGTSLPENSWSDVIAAIGNYLYSYCPLFIAVEVAASMQQPKLIEYAVINSYLFNCVVYITTGLVVDSAWGAGMPTPITDSLTKWPALLANLILFYCTFLDFAIVGSVLNRELQAIWMPSFDRLCSMQNMPTWLLLTLPSLFFALMLSILTPKLDTLAGFLESLCIPVVMLFGVPCMLLLLLRRRDTLVGSADKGAAHQLTALELVPGWELALYAGVVIGIGLMIAIFVETAYSIFAETEYDGHYFCDVVARRTRR